MAPIVIHAAPDRQAGAPILIATLSGEALTKYDQKVTCCGGALAFSDPERTRKQIREIVELAYHRGAEMIVTPCPLCQANVEVYQSEINKKQGTKFNMPVVYYPPLTIDDVRACTAYAAALAHEESVPFAA